MKAEQMAADGHTKRRILVRSMRYGLPAQPALLVRGSSRRIMTLRFRPAYIRVINRRYLSTAATCSAFPKKTGWIFLCRGRSSPEELPIKTRQPWSFIRSLTSRSISEGKARDQLASSRLSSRTIESIDVAIATRQGPGSFTGNRERVILGRGGQSVGARADGRHGE